MDNQKLQEIKQKSQKIIESFPPQTKAFYQFHGVQMIGSNFPVELVETLYKKLKQEVYDAGDYFEINDNEEEQTFQVNAKTNIAKESQLFLVDHALTFKYNDLRKVLKANPQIIPRLEAMLKYCEQMRDIPEQANNNKEEEQKTADNATMEQMELEFDSMGLTEIGHLDFPANTVTLSLMNNDLGPQKQEEVLKKLEYLNLKVLWINENPLEDSQKVRQYVDDKSKIEVFNSKFTKHCTTWGLKYVQDRNLADANSPSTEHVYKLNVDGRDLFCVDLEQLKKFKNLREISMKEHPVEDEEALKKLLWILTELPTLRNIFVDPIVEHQLFQMTQNKQIPLEVANRLLVNKHSLLLHPAPTQLDNQLQWISNCIFKLTGCYRLASSDQLDESSTWYVNDEMGSMIPHSDTPNVRLIPFLFAPNNKLDEKVQAFSILWPVKDITKGENVYRDYLNGLTEERQRSSRLAIWFNLPKQYYQEAIDKFNNRMWELQKGTINVLEAFYKENAVSQRDYLAKISDDDSFFPASHKVVSDHELVAKYLTDKDKFQLVDNIDDATIIWLRGAADEEEWKKYKGKYFVNQFPYESCVVMKQNLAATVQDVLGDTKFLMRTYDLERELKEFIGDYYERDRKGEDNLWIIKPPNMARSMDMIISDNLPALIKSMETGPKIAQKYISNPVLRQGRKVDLRYVLLVKSVKPLTLFLYKHFWIRSSNNPYTVDRRALATYETQFTVMNYGEVSDFKQIPYKQFIEDFQNDYKPVKWSTIHDKIKKMLRNTFIACGNKYPQMQDDKSRAIYGIDIMMDQETMEPKLLEITFSPDCKRACEYYPTFYNEVFETLFMETVGENMERVI